MFVVRYRFRDFLIVDMNFVVLELVRIDKYFS